MSSFLFYEDHFLKYLPAFNISLLSFLTSELQVSMAGHLRSKEKVMEV